MPLDEMNPEGIFDVKEPVDEFGAPIPPEADAPPEDQEQESEGQEQKSEDQEQKSEGQEQPVVPGKRVQTPEENARFAEMRRQKELQERIEREAQARLQQTPEYKMAKFLADQYGMPVEQLFQKMQEAAIQKQAQERGVPVEVIKQIEAERRKREELEQRLNQTEFQNWYQQKMAEAAQIKQEYPFLTDAEITGAITYMLNDLGTTKMPLSQAVLALHGDKIASELRKAAKQEALAEVSGRKPGPLPPQGSKLTQTPTLTAEERYVAKQMGISEEDYIKYRDQITE